MHSLTTLGLIARVLSASFLVVMMFSLGLELGARPPKTKQAKRHDRRLLVRALVLNLVLMPFIAWAIVRGLHRSGVVATALLLVAATPGGRYAPRVAKLAHADLGLSVEITLFLAKLTSFTAPVTVAWLLGVKKVDLRELLLILQLLLFQMLPYLAGRLLRHKRAALAERLARPLLLAELAIGIALLGLLFGSGAAAELRTVGPTDWFVGLSFGVLLLVVGWTLGWPSPETRRAFAVTTTARNLSLALLIADELSGDRGVQLALFGIWLTCLVLDVIFAAAVRGQRPSPQPA
jgi:BASS family bile acid:Na+ symporter